MGQTYSTREAARLLKVSERHVRRWAALAGVGSRPHRGSPWTFDFRDLIALRTCKRLEAEGIAARRLERAVNALRHTLGSRLPLSAVRLHRQGNAIVASDGAAAWDVETQQCMLPFAGQTAPNVVDRPRDSLPPPAPTTASAPNPQAARQWFERAMALEDIDTSKAYQAYLQVLACNPEHPEATINIGRLCADAGDYRRAAAYFRQAIRVNPNQPVAHFNLGVTLHDIDQPEGAIEAYRYALYLDPDFADAHYNLATLLEQRGDRRGALKHMAAYRTAVEGPA